MRAQLKGMDLVGVHYTLNSRATASILQSTFAGSSQCCVDQHDIPEGRQSASTQ